MRFELFFARANVFGSIQQILADLLIAVDDSERFEKESGIPAFASQQTLDSLRLSLSSCYNLTQELLDADYDFVLTGKFNQDCIERFFGIVRAAGGGQEMPTVTSFMFLFRMLCVYYPTKAVLRKRNIDEVEKCVY